MITDTDPNDNFIQAAFRPYYQTPSFDTVVVGLGIGALALATTYFCFNNSTWLTNSFAEAPLLPKTNSIPLLASLVLIIGVVAPFFQESQHRATLENPTGAGILTNSLCYGVVSGLMPGSVDLRIARVFLGTVVSLFFCAARVQTGSVWGSAIASSLYNLAVLKTYF